MNQCIDHRKWVWPLSTQNVNEYIDQFFRFILDVLPGQQKITILFFTQSQLRSLFCRRCGKMEYWLGFFLFQNHCACAFLAFCGALESYVRTGQVCSTRRVGHLPSHRHRQVHCLLFQSISFLFFFCILSVVSLRRLQLITAVGAVLQSNSLTSIVYNAGWCPEHARQYSQVEIKYVWLVLSVVLGRFFCLSVNLFAYPHSYVPNAPSVVVQLVRWFVALSHTQTQPQTLEHCIRIDHFGWQHQHQFYVLRISIRGVPWTESLIFFNYNMVNVDRCCGDGRLKMRSVCRYRYHILHKHSNRILIDCRELENWFRKLTCVVCMLAGQWQYTVNGSFFFLFVFNIHFLTRSLLARLNKICSMWSLIGRRGVECRATWPAVEACFRWFIEIYSKRINNAGQCDRQQQPSITLYM